MQRVWPWQPFNLPVSALHRSCLSVKSSTSTGKCGTGILRQSRAKGLQLSKALHSQTLKALLTQLRSDCSWHIRSAQESTCLHRHCRSTSQHSNGVLTWGRCRSSAAATDVAETYSSALSASGEGANVISMLRARGLVQVSSLEVRAS